MVTKKPSRRDAYEYIYTVRDHFQDNREIYDTFLKVLKDFHSDRIGPSDVISMMIELFKGHQHLLLGFNKFLPEGSKITLESDQTLPKKPEFRHALDFVRKVKARLQDDRAYMSFITILKMQIEGKKCFTEVYHEVSEVLRDHPDLREEFIFFLPS
ncbi:Paired amphipathic helix (PAH2) superfamily protein [Raphanus sativus]|uniref:Paired amphipathic helix protein Sin3-like 5 n=1 Tax=Raphanus sativus TaxID=3726 RepID=A0A9W3CFC7_RAPSA|nr:paired amphipathic helix protein Sin3-like 5 [Raphanus sativus]KAJ4874708.1 Paired amphipathic helix (PAH2) superfamily protein [Raphanus sativus]